MTFTDERGREWRVHDFQVIAGKSSRLPIGRGSRRGFEPLDGGARRSYVLLQSDLDRGIGVDVLREQLAASTVYFLDDPRRLAEQGKAPERVDPPMTST